MAVDPDLVAVTPGIMSRHPDVISSTVPVARTMDIIGLIADSDHMNGPAFAT